MPGSANSPTLKTVARRLLPHSVYRRYRQRRVATLIAGYTARETEHTFGGHVLRVHLADPLGESWYDHDWPEPAFVEFLRGRGVLRPGAVVFDLGAHQAVVAIMLARAVGPTGKVVAIEAEPHNARVAEINVALNAARNVTVIHAAGAAEDGGFVNFAESLTGYVDPRTAAGNVRVPTITVDGLVAAHGLPDLVLIDVEGYEEQVLNGARGALANGRTSFLVEVHAAEELARFGGSSRSVAEILSGFDTYRSLDDDAPFTPLTEPPADQRFFLAALPRAASAPR
jgi:FkbM family methyltransferase